MLDRAEVTKLLTFIAEPRKTPVALSPAEVTRLLDVAPGVKYKAFNAAHGLIERSRFKAGTGEFALLVDLAPYRCVSRW